MGFFLLLSFAIIVLLWAEISSLKTKVERLNEQFIATKDEIATMAARLLRLEHGRPATVPAAAFVPPSSPAPALAAAAEPMPRPTPISMPAPAPAVEPAITEPAESWEMVVGTSWLNK